MTNEAAWEFINGTLLPNIRVSDPSALVTIQEDFEALAIAFETGNTTLMFAMSSYIEQCRGLLNGLQIARLITVQIFNRS